MGKAEGEERKEIVKGHARWRNKVKQIQKKRRWEKELRLNFEIENLEGKDEREYWRRIKELAGLHKGARKLPEEMRMGENLVGGEEAMRVWEEAFKTLGQGGRE